MQVNCQNFLFHWTVFVCPNIDFPDSFCDEYKLIIKMYNILLTINNIEWK